MDKNAAPKKTSEQSSAASAGESRLHVKATSARNVSLLSDSMVDSGSAMAMVAYGQSASVILATREAGYHSKPHRHEAEQINYILEGEAWVFIEDTGFHVGKGDLLRIPKGCVHWAWVTGTSKASVLEVHTPPLTADYSSGRISMLTDASEEDQVDHVSNTDAYDFDWQSVERRVVGKSYSDQG